MFTIVIPASVVAVEGMDLDGIIQRENLQREKTAKAEHWGTPIFKGPDMQADPRKKSEKGHHRR